MNYFLITLLTLFSCTLMLLVLAKFLPNKEGKNISEEEEE